MYYNLDKSYEHGGMTFDPTTPNWQAFMDPPGPVGNPANQMLGFGQDNGNGNGNGVVIDETVVVGNGTGLPPWVRTAWKAAGVAAAAAGVYHGYKRATKRPVLNALWYGFLGAAVPIIAVPVMIAQGFGKKKG